MSELLLFGLEQVGELNRSHHLAGAVAEFGQHNALGLEGLVKVVIVFAIFQHNFVPILFLGLILILDIGDPLPEIVVEGEPINEEVMDFESVKLLFVLD